MILLQLLILFIWILFTYLLIIIFVPNFNVPRQDVEREEIDSIIPPNRESVSFSVDGSKIDAWFYSSDKGQYSPCIVMSHGFGGTKDMLLEQYALKFTSIGYHTLIYDYRFFGSSEGEPRQLFCGAFQVDDLKAAIEYVRSREDVDSSKIVLWGTSNGARYGIIVASEDRDIAGVIAQCGAYDNREDSRFMVKEVGKSHFLKLFVHAQRDKGRSRLGLSPHYYPMYGRPGTTALITTKGAFEGVEQLAKFSPQFINETCARLLFMPQPPDVLKVADSVVCPVQLLICLKDGIVSPKSHIKLTEILGDLAEVKEYDIEHFDIYVGEGFNSAMLDQLHFLNNL